MTHLRRNLMVGAIACAIADAGLLAWLLSPRAPSKAATEQQLSLTRAQLAGLRSQDRQLALLDQRLALSQQQVQELMAAGVPEDAEASSKLLAEFSRIANASSVEVSGAEFHPDKSAREGLRRVAISLQVAGGYGSVVRFINQLERSPMFFIINQVAVTGSNPNPALAALDSVKLELQLEAYVRAAKS
ncbi:MAG TPA: type 4a pilus biogenesis protein PilO [Terriglobales bacterium]|nr:type 4a pilus biogenesis protein PilO [Terriglobales bacterium]